MNENNTKNKTENNTEIGYSPYGAYIVTIQVLDKFEYIGDDKIVDEMFAKYSCKRFKIISILHQMDKSSTLTYITLHG